MNLQAHKINTKGLDNIYRPDLLRLQNNEDRKRFEELLKSPALFLHDEIDKQLQELIKSRNASKILNEEESKQLVYEHAGGEERLGYGVWVYYPWSLRLVHMLDETEFAEVRTSRNQYKITRKEQQVLSLKKTGIIGLSVGQSVALTMAMERSFGEIRLADFDVLELTNLNRIRTGVHNLGLKKAISVAREIAGIDPFLKVIVFAEGLNEDNIETFLTAGGKLDVLIDECDGIDMKILCRHEAKKLQIPVLMEASDRCTVDVERFDLDPERPLLHGYIDHLDVSRLKYLKTNEEKIPYLAPMVGIDTMSVRLKASAMEVGHSITTWPQLASAVTMGGGVIADIWRRIALGQFHESGRYFIDVEEIAGDKPGTNELNVQGEEPLSVSPLARGQLLATVEKYFTSGKAGSTIPSGKVIRTLVTAAGMAPSGGNSQPWKWVYKEGVLFLFLDKYEGYSYMNFRDTSSYIALGAAIENLVLKAFQNDLEIKSAYFPVAEDNTLVAAFSFYKKGAATGNVETVADAELVNFIEKRHTNRKFPPRVTFPEATLEELKRIAETISGVNVTYTDNEAAIIEIGKMIGITDRYRILHPKSNYDFTHREMRWTDEEATRKRTGMHIGTLELRESELIGLKFIKDLKVVDFISKINGGHLLKNASVKNAASAAVFGLLTVPSSGNADFLNGGRAAQRLWLKATQLGLSFHTMNVPLAYFARLKHDKSDLPEGVYEEVLTLYKRFTEIFKHTRKQEEIYLFRIFKAEEPSLKSYRKRIDDILISV